MRDYLGKKEKSVGEYVSRNSEYPTSRQATCTAWCGCYVLVMGNGMENSLRKAEK